jgi:predicted alpha/beta superfamily hydrolase
MTDDWRKYHDDFPNNTVSGDLRYRPDVYSEQLDNTRALYVWVPPGYDDDETLRFPVLYMHDGQNLFDETISGYGTWNVDNTLTTLAADGIRVIVVGIPNIPERRGNEYSPYAYDRWGDGEADDYLDFVVHTVKPMIDADFRTKKQPVNSGMMGSSLGGLVSLYAGFAREVFGKIGALSPFWMPFGDKIANLVQTAPRHNLKIYMDVGTAEGANMEIAAPDRATFSANYVESVRTMRDLLVEKGYRTDRALKYVEAQHAIHHESAWEARLPDALRFLFG